MDSPLCSLYVSDYFVSGPICDREESIALGLKGVDEFSCGIGVEFFLLKYLCSRIVKLIHKFDTFT